MQSPDSTATSLPIDKKPDATTSLTEEKPEDLIPLWQSAIDSSGRRSLAFRRGDTGELTTWSEIYERNMPSPEEALMRRYFRRLDGAMCWFLFEDWKYGWARSLLQFFCLPLLFPILGYIDLRTRWDIWRQPPEERHGC